MTLFLHLYKTNPASTSNRNKIPKTAPSRSWSASRRGKLPKGVLSSDLSSVVFLTLWCVVVPQTSTLMSSAPARITPLFEKYRLFSCRKSFGVELGLGLVAVGFVDDEWGGLTVVLFLGQVFVFSGIVEVSELGFPCNVVSGDVDTFSLPSDSLALDCCRLG